MSGVPAILKQKLVAPCKTAKSRWWLRHAQDEGVWQAVEDAIHNPTKIPAEDHLKEANRRLVFRLNQLVVKAFPLQGVRRWAGKHAYARQECVNLLEAEARGVPVPDCMAYGERPFFGGLAWNATVMRYVAAPTFRDHWLANPNAINAAEDLERITPLAIQLYHTGSNHIDFGPHAILRSRELEMKQDCLIDWQYASFYQKPNPYVFASQIGYFGWSTATKRSWLQPSEVRQWFDTLWETYGIAKHDACRKIFERTLAKRHPIQDRLNAASTFAP